ncbi:hypothetical protein [Microtetraspora malaysiensis]|uniref:hypothetical protein n=1 Tax=Microtetraspora malaysiensis TaxID=161358 RepID=UPI003D8B99E3
MRSRHLHSAIRRCPTTRPAKLGMIWDENPTEWAHAPAHSRPAPATRPSPRPGADPDGNFYGGHYQRGLTEYQDTRPWDLKTAVECEPCQARTRMVEVTDYIPANQANGEPGEATK